MRRFISTIVMLLGVVGLSTGLAPAATAGKAAPLTVQIQTVQGTTVVYEVNRTLKQLSRADFTCTLDGAAVSCGNWFFQDSDRANPLTVYQASLVAVPDGEHTFSVTVTSGRTSTTDSETFVVPAPE